MKENNLTYMATMNIFGSCVSRDVLEAQQEKRIFLQNYIARESIVSALSEPVLLEEDKLNLKSTFQKNMVIHDFQKDVFEVFEKNRTDVILIDFIDERFPLAKLGHSYVTYSNELMTSGYISNPKLVNMCRKTYLVDWVCCKKSDKWKVGRTSMNKFIGEFCQKLLNIYCPDQIILHEIYLSDYYVNGENQLRLFPDNYLKNNKKINEKYEYIYHKFKEYIPQAHVINYSGDYVADENHKWGLSPMHFQKEYYEKVLNEIYGIISRQKNRI